MKIKTGLAYGQVLQRRGARGALVQLQGDCETPGAVYATIREGNRSLRGWKKSRVGKAAQGQFTVALKGIPAGGPYRLELQAGKEKAEIEAFYVGDVWLMAGQSNMEGVGDMTHPAQPHPLIRSFSMRREWVQASDPLHVVKESPDFSHNGGQQYTPDEARRHRRTAKKGVGVGIFFAREMLKRTGVPQGLICTAHGGTSMDQWDPALKKTGGASLYGSMLLSVAATHQPVAGVLWYQGESDTGEGQVASYAGKMKKLVAASRRDLRQPTLPWIVAQIGCVCNYLDQAPGWNRIQEEQRRLPESIDRLQTIATVDLPLDDVIHIGALGYRRLGVRMARMADRLALGNSLEKPAPALREIRLNQSTKSPGRVPEPTIDVSFDHLAVGLRATDEPRGFTLITDDGRPWPFIYKTTLRGPVARLHLTRPPLDNLQLHYGHGVVPVCNITDGRDLSLPVFGPLPLGRRLAYLPFVTEWRVTEVITKPAASLRKMELPDLADFKSDVKSYATDGMINEHPAWENKSGQAYFSSWITLPEAMKLKFLMGYDGPFRLWLDEKPLFADLKGTNPCLPDEGSSTVALRKGRKKITVAMDINNGQAWGFMLRFQRVDVTPARAQSGDFVRPVYSAS